jgi:hypothetical protein
VFFPLLDLSDIPDILFIFYELYHYDRLSSYRHRLFNLPGTRHMTQRWQSVGGALGRRLSVKQKKDTLYMKTPT